MHSSGTPSITRGPDDPHNSPSPIESTPFTGRPVNDSLLLKVSEAAAVLRISRSSLYRLFEQACTDWLRSRHKIRPTTAAGCEFVLQPVQSELGARAVQDLTRRYIDDLIVKLRAGELVAPGGKARKAWSARSCNYMLGALSQILGQLVAEGRLTRGACPSPSSRPGSATPIPHS
jgi:hypothetical protein